jgi:CRP-like cAMP-binding protein
VLVGLPGAAQERLRPYVERVPLSKDRLLLEAGAMARHAYFPVSGLVSWQALTDEGHAFDVAVVGSEGLVGATIVLPQHLSAVDLRVQLPGEADRIRADAVLCEFRRGEDFQQAVLSHVHDVVFQMVQSAVCVHAHSLSQRLCRWLLLSYDRLYSEELVMTHNLIANMLGVRRESVAHAAKHLQSLGFIRYERGHIAILDQSGLEATVCECYRVVKDEYERLLGGKEREASYKST